MYKETAPAALDTIEVFSVEGNAGADDLHIA